MQCKQCKFSTTKKKGISQHISRMHKSSNIIDEVSCGICTKKINTESSKKCVTCGVMEHLKCSAGKAYEEEYRNGVKYYCKSCLLSPTGSDKKNRIESVGSDIQEEVQVIVVDAEIENGSAIMSSRENNTRQEETLSENEKLMVEGCDNEIDKLKEKETEVICSGGHRLANTVMTHGRYSGVGLRSIKTPFM